MYKTVTRNLRKRKKNAETWFLETTTMFAVGEQSVAEATYGEANALLEGRKTRGRHRLLYDHRWGECPDVRVEEDLRKAIEEAFGEALDWNDIDGIVDEFYDSRNDEVESRRYFLNAQESASDAWLRAHEWDAAGRPDRSLKPKDLVVLGFDGSRSSDATALVACRIVDGHLELLHCQEPPDGVTSGTFRRQRKQIERELAEHGGDGLPAEEIPEWQVDRVAVDAAVREAMKRFEVAGFYCDPAHFQDYVDAWTRDFGEKMRVKATAGKPLEWWTNRPRPMVAALQRFHEAVLDKSLSFTPADDRVGLEAKLAMTLRRHALNARRKLTNAGVQIGKDYPKSPRRIDGVMAAVLAFEARGDAVAAGVKPARTKAYAARRIR